MCRSSLALLATLCLASVCQASRPAAADRVGLHDTVAAAAGPAAEPQPRNRKASGELIINDKTEIRLDGNAVRLDAIPASAEVFLLEVGADQRTVVRLHFRRK